MEDRARMNVAAHQEKKENENTDKREVEEEEKNSCMTGMPGVTGTLRRSTAILPLPKRDRTTTLSRLLISAE